MPSSSSASDGTCSPYPIFSTPSDPLNACFAINGKCYKCNPDRGAECGYNWLWNTGFSEGNIGWWYKEISCNGASNKCPDNALLKKSILGRDSENIPTDGSRSDYVWRKNSKFFYDAMGRRTQTHPETRRYLFLPKRNVLDYEQNPQLLGSVSFTLKTTVDGYVNAEHIFSTNYDWIKTPEISLKIYLSLKTVINIIEHKNDSLLIAHENKHIEIYNSLGNIDWEKTIQIDDYDCESYENICSRYKQEVRSEYEAKLTALINAQNKWDDDDKNNISHERIDLQQKLNEMYQYVYNIDCPSMP